MNTQSAFMMAQIWCKRAVWRCFNLAKTRIINKDFDIDQTYKNVNADHNFMGYIRKVNEQETAHMKNGPWSVIFFIKLQYTEYDGSSIRLHGRIHEISVEQESFTRTKIHYFISRTTSYALEIIP